jgi:hypothetical protein
MAAARPEGNGEGRMRPTPTAPLAGHKVFSERETGAPATIVRGQAREMIQALSCS